MGTLGSPAHRFLDQLQAARQSFWQMLPIHPPGRGFSPYEASSAIAGNPAFLTLTPLVEAGWLEAEEVSASAESVRDTSRERRGSSKDAQLRNAFQGFVDARDARSRRVRERFEAYVEAERAWLDDFTLFTALSGAEGTAEWTTWDEGVRRRRAGDLRRVRQAMREELRYLAWLQFLFCEQWTALREAASDRGIRLVGDVPIYVSHRSADVWAHGHLFQLDRRGRPRMRAGVPPDFFSRTGQLWGNPLYDWKQARGDGYAWWVSRLRHELRHFDKVRLDHFIGFERAWGVGPRARTALRGRWIAGPRAHFFESVRASLGGLPFIAEDLGRVTPAVEALRDAFELPGMRVLQMAFGNTAENPHLPHNHVRNGWVYTGTHDNATTVEWWRSLVRARGAERSKRDRVLGYVGSTASEMRAEPHWTMIRLAYASVADTAIVPLQDVLGLGAEARMNTPATIAGNWDWRLAEHGLDGEAIARLAAMAETFGRAPRATD